MKNNKLLNAFLKILGLVIISIIIGTLLMMLMYSIPLDLLMNNAKNSITVFSDNIVKQWAGYTRYSHISNTTDEVIINAAICRPYDSLIDNAMLNPHYSDFIESFSSTSVTVENFPRYWHGYLIYIIPALLVTNAGGIRMLFAIVEYMLTAVLLIELYKRNKMYMYIYGIAALFINPITAALSYQDADIYILMMIFSIIALKHNEYLKQNNRYLLLFALIGIITSFVDYLSYPLVSWGIPLATIILINKNELKDNILFIILCSISWIIGYVGMWAGKWIVATLLTDVDVIADAINQVAFRTVGDGYGFIETLYQVWESVNDPVLLILYALGIIIIIIYAVKNKLSLHLDKQFLLDIIPLLIVALGPFAWYFVIRNHTYIHVKYEHRQLATSIFCYLMCLLKAFRK